MYASAAPLIGGRVAQYARRDSSARTQTHRERFLPMSDKRIEAVTRGPEDDHEQSCDRTSPEHRHRHRWDGLG